MTVKTVEQVIIGKMLMPNAQGQISLFTLPEEFVWLKHFTAEEIAEFFAELLATLDQSKQSEDWSLASDVIETWKATANIKAVPDVSDAVDQGLNELADKQGVSWSALKKDLAL